MRRLIHLSVIVLATGCSPADHDARAAVRTAVLAGFTTALAAEGPVERTPLLVAREMDSAESRIDAALPVLTRQFPAYDREALADLLNRMRTPGMVTIPESQSESLQLVSDSAARLIGDSIALTGQLITRISPVGLNPSATRAVVVFAVECGTDCGARQLIFLAGKRDRWIPVQRIRFVDR